MYIIAMYIATYINIHKNILTDLSSTGVVGITKNVTLFISKIFLIQICQHWNAISIIYNTVTK